MSITLTPEQYQQALQAVQYQPGYVMWKHKDLSYVAANDHSAQMLGYRNADHFVGHTDFDIKLNMSNLTAFAELLRKRSTALFENNQDNQFIQFIPFDSGYQLMLGAEHIIRNINGEAVSLCLSAQEISLSTMLSIGILMHPVLKDKIKQKEKFILNMMNQYDKIDLGKRQSQCLYYLLCGLSIKETAQKMQVSPRTIESHLERIKFILKCNNKPQLIEKAISLNLIDYIII